MPNLHSVNSPRYPAAQQASTPLTETRIQSIQALCENRLNQIQSPDLPSFLPEHSGQSVSRQTEAVERFKSSLAFPPFRMELLRHFQNLYRETADLPAQPFEQSAWGRFAGRLGLITLHADDAAFNAELYMLYEHTCPLINRLSVMLQLSDQFHAQFPSGMKGELMHQLKQLKSTLGVCGPGVAQNIASTYNTLKYRLLPPDLHTLFKDTRLQIARNHFQQIVQAAYHADPNLSNNEIHMVAAFQNTLSDELDLPKIEDQYAASQYVTDCGMTIEKIGLRLMIALTPESVCAAMATQALEVIQGHMAQAGPVPADPQQFNRLLEEGLEQVKPVIGEVSAHLVCDMDDNQLPNRITRNPTLLALELLQRLPGDTRRAYFENTILLNGARPHSPRLKISTNLVWVEETLYGQTEKRLLGLEDLTPGNTQQILNINSGPRHRLSLMAHEVLRNLEQADTLYFQQVPFKPWADELNDAALAAAFATRPAGSNQPAQLTRHFINSVQPTGAALLLLSSEANLLSQEQRNFLVERSESAEFISTTEGYRFNFPDFVLKLDNQPAQNLHRASPQLFRKVIAETPFTHSGATRFRMFWALETEPAYLDIARQMPSLKGYLNAEEIFPGLVTEHDSGNTKALRAMQRMINEIAEPANQPQNHKYLIRQLVGSTLPDWQSASMLRVLLNKNTSPETAANNAREFETSALGLALCNGKPQCTGLILAEETTIIPSNTHDQVWVSFGRMLQRVSDPAQTLQILHALLAKGVRVHMPEVHTSALIALCVDGRRLIDQQLITSGCDVSARNSEGRNALFIATQRMAPLNRIRELLDIGVPVEMEGENYPVIELALVGNNVDAAGLFYRHTGNLDMLDSDGYAAIHRAILQASRAQNELEKTIEIRRVEALLKAGCNPNTRTSVAHMWKTPLHLAYKHLHEVCSVLFHYGASPQLLDLKLRAPKALHPRDSRH